MKAKYYDLDMNPIDTKDLLTTNLHIPSVPFDNIWTGGTDGIRPIFSGVNVQQKTIEATVELISNDYLDYNLLRDKLYGIFGINEPFYVIDKRQPFKRHKVILESGFTPVRLSSVHGTAVIPFITDEIPYSESIGTTQDIHENGVSSDDELWGFGMGIIDEMSEYEYLPATWFYIGSKKWSDL